VRLDGLGKLRYWKMQEDDACDRKKYFSNEK
jgi:hypothetical protein